MDNGNERTQNRLAAFEARSLRLNVKAADAASIAPAIEKQSLSRGAQDVIVEIKAAGVNPSDVKAATGLMPYAVFPRTPGRDFAGVVVDGPSEWLGARGVRLLRRSRRTPRRHPRDASRGRSGGAGGKTRRYFNG